MVGIDTMPCMVASWLCRSSTACVCRGFWVLPEFPELWFYCKKCTLCCCHLVFLKFSGFCDVLIGNFNVESRSFEATAVDMHTR